MTGGHFSATELVADGKYYILAKSNSSMCLVRRSANYDRWSLLDHAASLFLRRDCYRSRTQWPYGGRLPGCGGPVHTRARATGGGGRLLCYRGDSARLPRLNHFLQCQHAAAGDDPRSGPGWAWIAHGPV